MATLTNAQKHELLIRFNQERELLANGYQEEKKLRKEEEAKNGTAKEEGNMEYRKLYKKLGQQNNNKDIRKQLQEEVDMYTDNQLSTSLQMNATPGYSMSKYNQISSTKTQF